MLRVIYPTIKNTTKLLKKICIYYFGCLAIAIIKLFCKSLFRNIQYLYRINTNKNIFLNYYKIKKIILYLATKLLKNKFYKLNEKNIYKENIIKYLLFNM